MNPHSRQARRDFAARLSLLAAFIFLTGWLVANLQAFLTFNRLMVATDSRTATPLADGLLGAGATALTIYLALRLFRGSKSARHCDRTSSSHAWGIALAAFFSWYMVAVAQWYLVIRQATTDPSRYERDPTVIEYLLLAGGAVALSYLALKAVVNTIKSRNTNDSHPEK